MNYIKDDKKTPMRFCGFLGFLEVEELYLGHFSRDLSLYITYYYIILFGEILSTYTESQILALGSSCIIFTSFGFLTKGCHTIIQVQNKEHK